LQLGHQPDAPAEQKACGHAVPRIQEVCRLGSAESINPADEARDSQWDGNCRGACRQNHPGDGVEGPRAAPLVERQPPAEPDEGLEVLPVHDAASSSQLSLRVASGSAPACSRKRCSSEPPRRIASNEPCSTSCPLTMIPTYVHRRSTISSTCDVR